MKTLAKTVLTNSIMLAMVAISAMAYASCIPAPISAEKRAEMDRQHERIRNGPSPDEINRALGGDADSIEEADQK